MSDLTKEEFVRRFADELVRIVGPGYRILDDDGRDTEEEGDTREYALETAPSYFDEPDQRVDGPEECARADYSYWEG